MVVDAGKLQCNIAGPNDAQLLGNAGKVEDLIADDGMLRSRDWQLRGLAACRYENVLCLQAASSTGVGTLIVHEIVIKWFRQENWEAKG